MKNELNYLNWEISQLSNTSTLFLNILAFGTHRNMINFGMNFDWDE